MQPTTGDTRSWSRALGEHDAAVSELISIAKRIPEKQWRIHSAPGKWCPAEEVLHVTLSYEVALRGVRSGEGMRPRVSPARARFLRRVVLPVMLATRWFPRARAPVEIRPPKPEDRGNIDLTRLTLVGRLEDRAREVRDELPASRPELRFHHAYFGDLPPKQALRMLAAHTRHHSRGLARRFPDVTG